jgi:hypothetical protein
MPQAHERQPLTEGDYAALEAELKNSPYLNMLLKSWADDNCQEEPVRDELTARVGITLAQARGSEEQLWAILVSVTEHLMEAFTSLKNNRQ